MRKLVNDLITIPHLKLEYPLDLKGLQSEIDSISTYYPYDIGANHRFQSLRKKYLEAWSVVSLIDYHGKPEMGALSFHDNNNPGDIDITDIGAQCPKTLSLIQKFQGNRPNRARFCRVSPTSDLNFHSHIRDHKAPVDEVIVNIPLRMKGGFTYSVSQDNNLKKDPETGWYEVIDQKKLVNKSYSLGDIHIFNSFFYHSVSNSSDLPRYALVFYANLRESKFLANLTREAVDSYDGPRLKFSLV